MSQAVKLPFQIDRTGRVAAVSGRKSVIAQQIVNLISTQQGERVMRPSYGVRTQMMLFEPLDNLFAAQLESEMRDAMRRWEPSAELVSVNAVESSEGGSMAGAQVEVLYRLKQAGGASAELNRAVIDLSGTVEEVRGA